MSEQLVISSVLKLVPQWYFADTGPEQFTLRIGDTGATFFCHRKLTPQLWELLKYAELNAKQLLGFSREFPASIAVDLIQDFMALKWLNLTGPWINWRKGLAYFRELNERTYENTAVSKNLVIGKGEGTADITESRHSKVIDPLAISQQVFLKVDREFRFCDYCDIPWQVVKDTSDYKFHPEFLHPFFCVLSKEEFAMHKTAKNDLVIMQGGFGVIATKRRGRWKFYDANTLKNSLRTIWANYRIGCNLYEALFDLSFRRHGALLVFDPEQKTLDHIANPHSRIHGVRMQPGSAHSILAQSAKKINMRGWNDEKPRIKRVFLELAGLDGAVIFNDQDILAFGAMITTHPDAQGQYGARTTAALSAFHWGGLPSKISSDGEVSCYFTSESKDGKKRTAALLNFA